MQRQLTAIRTQNDEQDVILKNVQKDIDELKASKRSLEQEEVPTSKRSRKTPRGLSVSFFVHNHFTLVDLTHFQSQAEFNPYQIFELQL